MAEFVGNTPAVDVDWKIDGCTADVNTLGVDGRPTSYIAIISVMVKKD